MCLEMAQELISSQRYRSEAIIEEKRAARDYVVSYYDLTVGGVEYRAIIDGHHSLSAAIADGVEPEFRRVDRSISSEYDHVVATIGVEAWIAQHTDAAWHDPVTGSEIW